VAFGGPQDPTHVQDGAQQAHSTAARGATLSTISTLLTVLGDRSADADLQSLDVLAGDLVERPAACHSLRNATSGSMRVARRAGMYDAAIATRPKINATATNVVGSSGVMPKSIP